MPLGDELVYLGGNCLAEGAPLWGLGKGAEDGERFPHLFACMDRMGDDVGEKEEEPFTGFVDPFGESFGKA